VEVGPLLADLGLHVLAVAPPGGGETPTLDDPDDYRPRRLAQRVLELADAHGIDRFVFMGASWGASIGVHLAAGAPQRVGGLVMLDGGHVDVALDKPRDELVAEFEADQERFAFDGWDAFLAWARDNVRSWRPSLEPRYRLAMTERGDGKIVPRAVARAAAWAIHGVVVEPPSTAHAGLSMPVLLVLADDKRDAESEARFQEAVPHARLEVLHSGHDVVEDAPAETVALVADWLG
jgi:pimeloyl-ACP methyl ester carboxylesterase